MPNRYKALLAGVVWLQMKSRVAGFESSFEIIFSDFITQ
jgi:hypothetical protein